jgi:DNA-binding transcriptional MerR regulator
MSSTPPHHPPFKIGALASATGVSVRTLHHYDAIGLLVPSGRTSAGHRVYDAHDVQRLQQIQSLKAVGFPLEEIRRLLMSRAISAQRVIALHLERLEAHIASQQTLRSRLQRVARHLDAATAPPLAELCRIIEGTHMMDRYFPPNSSPKSKRVARRSARCASPRSNRPGPK